MAGVAVVVWKVKASQDLNLFFSLVQTVKMSMKIKKVQEGFQQCTEMRAIHDREDSKGNVAKEEVIRAET